METQLTVKNLQYQSWLAMVQQQVKSGLSVREWCRQNSVSTKTFYFRRKRIREELLQAASPTFAEVTRPVPAPQPSGNWEPFAPSLTISINDVVISVGQSTSRELLSDVLTVVRNA